MGTPEGNWDRTRVLALAAAPAPERIDGSGHMDRTRRFRCSCGALVPLVLAGCVGHSGSGPGFSVCFTGESCSDSRYGCTPIPGGRASDGAETAKPVWQHADPRAMNSADLPGNVRPRTRELTLKPSALRLACPARSRLAARPHRDSEYSRDPIRIVASCGGGSASRMETADAFFWGRPGAPSQVGDC